MALAFGEFLFDPSRRALRRHGVEIKLHAQLLELLGCLLAQPGQLISREQILQLAWEGRAVSDSALSVAVAKLRKVLGDGAKNQYIENRYGRGYRFVMPVTTVSDVRYVSAPPRAQAAATPGLLGRSELLSRLDALQQEVCAGRGVLCALVGEPGIGQTRFAESVEQQASRRGFRTAWARYMAAKDAPPLYPIVQALRELELTEAADELLASAELGARTTPPLDGMLQATGAVWHRTLDQLSHSLSGLSQAQPLLLLLDDLHWADNASLRLLSYLLNELARLPILVVATLRNTELDAAERRPELLLSVLSHRRCERFELQRLSEADVAAYVQQQFGDDAPALAHAVYARSEGNPFCMVELLRPWAGLTAPLPEQLRYSGLALDLVRQRLADLPEHSRSALATAAVLGHDFDLGLLSRVTERSADQLLAALDDSLANGSIVASSHNPGAFSFEHELIREVLYADVPVSERCRLHLQIGHALLQRRAAGMQISSAQLAHQFLSALPHGAARTAIDHARSAAAGCMRIAAHADARALLLRAHACVQFWAEPDAAVLTALLLELALCERLLGDANYTEHLKRGVAIARQHRLGPVLALAGQLLSPGPGWLARNDASAVLEAALEVLPEEQAAQRAITLCHLAWTPPNCMSARKVNALLDQAQAVCAQTTDPEAHAKLRDARLFFGNGPANHEATEQLAREIERDLKKRPETARSTRVVPLSTCRLLLAMQRGDEVAVGNALAQRRAAFAPLKNTELDWHEQRLQLIMRMNRGDFSGVGKDLQQLRTRAERLRLQSARALWARDLGQLLYWTGDFTQLAASLQPSLSLAASDTPLARSYKLRALVDLGLLEDARQALASITPEALRDLPQDRDYLAVLAQLSLAISATGARELAAVVYELLTPYPQLYAASVAFENLGSISHYLGLLAQTTGQTREAASHYTQAIQHNQHAGLPTWTAKSQYTLAKLLLSCGRDEGRAELLLTAARTAAERLGITPMLLALDAEG